MRPDAPHDLGPYTAYPGDVLKASLSLAVSLADDYTGGPPPFKTSVRLGGRPAPFVNLGGHYCFSGLAPGNYRLLVESEYYFPAKKDIAIPRPDPLSPVMGIKLVPNPAYPFPGDATLVRGQVWDGGPVADASVCVLSPAAETVSDEDGGFALYFKGFSGTVSIEIKKGGLSKTLSADVLGGRTNNLRRVYLP